MEEAKVGIIALDAEIAKAREFELAAKHGLLTQSDAPSSSGSDSEFLETEKGSEGDDVEDQTRENVEPSVDSYISRECGHFSSSWFRRCCSVAFLFFFPF